MMKCQFKENESCCKQVILYILAVFLTILGGAVALKIIILILCIFPGSIHENTWLVVISIVLVLFATKCYNKGHCGCYSECNFPSNKNQKNTQDNSQ